MKKIFAILGILGTLFASFATQAAENPFLSLDWWKTATPEMVENAICNGADVKVRNGVGLCQGKSAYLPHRGLLALKR